VYVRLVVLVACGVAAGCGGAPLPGSSKAPRLLEPPNGDYTGSVASDANLRPAFRWSAVPGADGYRFQLGEVCDGTPVSSCEITTPLLDRTVGDVLELQPTAALPVSTTAPVGRRYYWRVEACHGGDCGPWSAVRYLNVGRMAQDANGDGFGEIVSSLAQPPRAFVIAGGTTLDPTQPLVALDVSRNIKAEKVVTRWLGDVDGDGFSDLAVGQPGGEGLPGRVQLFRGGADLGATTSTAVLDGPTGFGAAVAAGDFNADGFRDVLVCGPTPTAFLGPDLGLRVSLEPPPGYDVGSAPGCSAAGDLDGDGADDAIVTGLVRGGQTGASALYYGAVTLDGAWNPEAVMTGYGPVMGPAAGVSATSGRLGVAVTSNTKSGQGGAHGVGIYFPPPRGSFATMGRPSIWVPVPTSLPAMPANTDSFGEGLGSWRMDRRGPARLVVGFPGANGVFLFAVGDASAEMVATYVAEPEGVFSAMGRSVGFPGDANGDGFEDMVVGNPFNVNDDIGSGTVYFYLGGASLPATSSLTLSGKGRGLGLGQSVD
jgi:hypothetical protein